MSSKFHRAQQKAQWSAAGIRVSRAYLHKVRRPLLLQLFKLWSALSLSLHVGLCVLTRDTHRHARMQLECITDSPGPRDLKSIASSLLLFSSLQNTYTELEALKVCSSSSRFGICSHNCMACLVS